LDHTTNRDRGGLTTPPFPYGGSVDLGSSITHVHNPIGGLAAEPPLRIICGSAMGDRTMARGTVKWFNSQKGYGFIQPQGGGGKDVFVHISAVERAGLSSLNEGQVIEYEIVENRGKQSAENLKVSR
jgi:cold shock protein